MWLNIDCIAEEKKWSTMMRQMKFAMEVTFVDWVCVGMINGWNYCYHVGEGGGWLRHKGSHVHCQLPPSWTPSQSWCLWLYPLYKYSSIDGSFLAGLGLAGCLYSRLATVCRYWVWKLAQIAWQIIATWHHSQYTQLDGFFGCPIN